MITTLFLAKFFGLYLLLVGVAMLVNPERMKEVIDDYQSQPAQIFIVGIFTLMLGLFLVLAHNVWTLWLPFFVTLFAWATLLKGMMLITYPDAQLSMATTVIRSTGATRISAVISAVLGAIMTWFGFMG